MSISVFSTERTNKVSEKKHSPVSQPQNIPLSLFWCLLHNSQPPDTIDSVRQSIIRRVLSCSY